MKNYLLKLKKRTWYEMGGFSNPKLFRVDKGRGWEYYRIFR